VLELSLTATRKVLRAAIGGESSRVPETNWSLHAKLRLEGTQWGAGVEGLREYIEYSNCFSICFISCKYVPRCLTSSSKASPIVAQMTEPQAPIRRKMHAAAARCDPGKVEAHKRSQAKAVWRNLKSNSQVAGKEFQDEQQCTTGKGTQSPQALPVRPSWKNIPMMAIIARRPVQSFFS